MTDDVRDVDDVVRNVCDVRTSCISQMTILLTTVPVKFVMSEMMDNVSLLIVIACEVSDGLSFLSWERVNDVLEGCH